MAPDPQTAAIDRRALLSGAWRQAKRPQPVKPPGAIDADMFFERCTGCGDCAEVCPADAIVMTGPATRTSASSPEVRAREAVPHVRWPGLHDGVPGRRSRADSRGRDENCRVEFSGECVLGGERGGPGLRLLLRPLSVTGHGNHLRSRPRPDGPS